MKKLLLSLFFLLISRGITMAQEFKLPIETKTLDNGLVVIVVENHSAPLVSVQVWYKAGSRYEHTGITGISHLLEHMMFKGTEKVGPEEYSLIIQRLGGIDNAFTSEDKTAYWSVVPSSQVEVPLELEADRMVNNTFREFESEKNVVMEERRWRTENSPWGTLFEIHTATCYIAHPYRYPVIGWMSDIESISLEDIKSYYENYYAPNNAILVIAGDIKPDKAFELAEKYFGGIKKKAHPNPPRTKEPEQLGERRVVVEKEGFAHILLISYHGVEFTHEDFPALYLLSMILGRGNSSRLYEKLVYETGAASEIGSWMERAYDPGLFNIYASISHNRTSEEVESLIYGEIEKIKKDGVNEEELKKALNIAISDFIFGQQSVSGMGMMVGDMAILDKPEAVNEWIPRLRKVKLEDLKRVAQKYLRRENRTVSILKPVPPKNLEEYMKKMKEASEKKFRR